MARKLYIDLETYSDTDLRQSTVYRYAESVVFEVMLAAYAFDDDPVRLLTGELELIEVLGDALRDPDVLKVAHNANFERICLSTVLGLESYLPPEQWDDTLARGRAWGYPGSLNNMAKAVGAEDKDEAGTRLINLFCKPYRTTRRTRVDKPEEWVAFENYCIQDVYTLRDVDQRLPGWPPAERAVWLADQRINDRGMAVDLELARHAVSIADQNAYAMRRELRALLDEPTLNPASHVQLTKAMARIGLELKDLRAETIASELARRTLTDTQRRVLEIRQELALSASKKFNAAIAGSNEDGRIRGSFVYFGAHTGRWSGRGLQPQNLPRAGFNDEETQDDTIARVLAGSVVPQSDLKKLVRPLFTGPLTVVDYSAIEARVVAWLAGEEWALQAFRDGRDIYVETANRMGMFPVDPELLDPGSPEFKEGRFHGKVAVLALGYNGAVGSMRAMGYGEDKTDEEIQRIVYSWRNANRNICRLWNKLESRFRWRGDVGQHLRVEADGDERRLVLPSGRALCYRGVGVKGDRLRFRDVRGFQVDTYGGRLTENATQAVARDLLAEGLVRLEQAGMRVVGHVHDEVLVEGSTVEEVSRILCETPSWATGLPVEGAGFQCKRYRKD